MRIVYLHQYFVTPEMSGGSRSYEMARRLVTAGHEVHMVTSSQDAAKHSTKWTVSKVAGINVHWISIPYSNSMSYKQRIWAFLTFAVQAARRAAELKGDLIFATSTPLTIALPAIYAARRNRIPMVFEVRDLWPAVPIAIGALRNRLLVAAAKWLERFAYRNAARVVALAPGMRSEIIAVGYPAECVTVIPNGCDLELFSNPDARGPIRRQHNWLGERPLLLYTGTFGHVNGMAYLARLAAEIAKIDSEVRIVGIGSGRDFESTRQLATELNVLDQSLFLLGRLPKTLTADWVLAADMTIALFTGPEIVWRDAVQNKFFDSLAAGKPVANNFNGWQAQLAANAGAGLILSATDLTSAANELVAALRDPIWLEEAGQSARALANERFDRDILAAQLARLLGEVHEEHVSSTRDEHKTLP